MTSVLYKVENTNGYKLYKNNELLLKSGRPITIAIFTNDGKYIGISHYFVTSKSRITNEVIDTESNCVEIYVKPI